MALPHSISSPRETQPRRMAPLSTLPIFVKLEGKRAIVCGNGVAAAWKAELLASAGATVEVFSDVRCPEIEALSDSIPAGRITLRKQRWSTEIFRGATIAVGVIDDEEEAARFVAAAKAAGAHVNIVDKPALCQFQFGTIVNRSPLVIGISTDGAAPVFAQSVRARIEVLLPATFARWTEIAKQWRTRIASLGRDAAARRRIWERFTERAFLYPGRVPSEADFALLERETNMAQRAGGSTGEVILVGAGPGDPELMTLRAIRALRTADVVLHDALVSAEVLDFARRESRRILVGKIGHGPSCKQDDINTLMVAFARAGKRVVRLKSGDPLIFGRAGEEMDHLRSAGIGVEIIPGISAGQAAAALLKIPLTQRNTSARVQFVTGHGRDGGLPRNMDWHALSDENSTTVVYMPRRTLPEFCQRLVAAGLPGSCPAVVMINVSRPGETASIGTVSDLPERLGGVPQGDPCLVLIGNVLRSTAEPRAIAGTYAHAWPASAKQPEPLGSAR